MNLTALDPSLVTFHFEDAVSLENHDALAHPGHAAYLRSRPATVRVKPDKRYRSRNFCSAEIKLGHQTSAFIQLYCNEYKKNVVSFHII